MLERRVEFPHANGRYSVDAMSSHLLNKFINLQVKTPTLFLLGAQDLRVPVSQTIYQWDSFYCFLNIEE